MKSKFLQIVQLINFWLMLKNGHLSVELWKSTRANRIAVFLQLASAIFIIEQSQTDMISNGKRLEIALGHHQILYLTCDWSIQKMAPASNKNTANRLAHIGLHNLNIRMTTRGLLCFIWFNLIAFPLYLVKLIVFNLVSSLKPISHGPWVGLWVERIVDQNLVQNHPFRKKSDSI